MQGFPTLHGFQNIEEKKMNEVTSFIITIIEMCPLRK